MTEYPFLPASDADRARRFAQRLSEAHSALNDPSASSRFPPWVRKMAGSVFRQLLPSATLDALTAREGDFTLGFGVGVMLAIQHLTLSGSSERLETGRLVARAQAQQLSSRELIEFVERLGEVPPLEIPEIQEVLAQFWKEVAARPSTSRARILEGVAAGSEIQDLAETGGFRLGTAFDVEFIMLMFWPELDRMPSREAAYQFLGYCFTWRNQPQLLGDISRFIQLAKRYGYRCRKCES